MVSVNQHAGYAPFRELPPPNKTNPNDHIIFGTIVSPVNSGDQARYPHVEAAKAARLE